MREKVEEKSNVKQTLNIKDYPDWLNNSILTIQPSPESKKDRYFCKMIVE